MNPRGYGKTLLGVLGGMLLATSAGAADGHAFDVRILSQESIAPKWITYRDHAEGICPDLLRAIEQVEPSLRFEGAGQGHSLPAIEAGLESGDVTAACALMDSPRRRAVARRVGPPLYTIRHRLAGRAGDPAQVENVADLVRLRALVNTARGSVFIRRLQAAGVAVDDSTGDNHVNLRKILAGHGRFTYMNELTLQRYIREERLEDKIHVLPLLEEEPAWFWVSRKADPAVAPLIGGALARLRANGALERIYRRWARPR